jgi:hypothetical protein
MFGRRKSRGQPKAEARDDPEHHDQVSLAKMSRVGFAAPEKVARSYRPARVEQRGNLRVLIFSEEEIIPWPESER